MARDLPDSWSELMREFEAHLIGSNMRPRTIEVRLDYVRRFSAGRSDKPADIEPRDIIRFLGRPEWASATRRVAQDGLVAFFRWAKKFNYLPTDPTTALTPVKQTPAPSEPATLAQIKQALKAAKDDRTRLMLRLSADAGLSALEMSQARPRDVFEVGGDHFIHVWGKGGVERDVFLLPELAAELRAKTTDYVFPGRPEPHLDAAYVVRLISAPLPKGVTSEDLRAAHKTGGRDSARGWREGDRFHPADALAFAENPLIGDNRAIQQQIKRIARDLDRDPAAAIGGCKEFLETLFKAVLDQTATPYDQGRHDSFPRLFELVSGALELPARSVPENVEASKGIGNLTDGLWLAAFGTGVVRNKVGTGHGHEDSPAEIRHARLIFNTTVTLSEFISDTWRAEHPD